MTENSRTLQELVAFAREVVGGRVHTKREAADFFRDLVAVAGQSGGEEGVCPTGTSPTRSGTNSVYLPPEANRFYTLAEARGLAAALIRASR